MVRKILKNIGYWVTHEYKRRSVKEITHFCGWDYLLDLITDCKNDRDKALISLLFCTGGRVSEVLLLERKNFQFTQSREFIIIVGMPILKRYKKIGVTKDEVTLKKKWKTKKELAYRTFPIKWSEPLTPYFTDYVLNREGKIFDISRIRVYQIVRELNKDIYPHWFRSQRASQLASEYKSFDFQKIMQFFGWQSIEAGLRYSHLGWKVLSEHMKK